MVADTQAVLAGLLARVRKPRLWRRIRRTSSLYAFAITSGEPAYGPGVFRVITASGESLALTHAMLDELRDVPLFVAGHATVMALLDAAAPGEATDPVTGIRLMQSITEPVHGAVDYLCLRSVLQPADLANQRFSLVAFARPAGWPP